ncbi:hypothetical protein BDV59DRAFT_25023 [Aspergillus ambiguus]|uniref:putative RING finger protein n=1 Tax=Aspergillus ambiguus TaxID=176160 RepID=UPI003CCCE5DF
MSVMHARSEESNPAAPLGYLAPLCVAMFFIFIWAIVGARHRYIRQGQADNPGDPESLILSRGVISRSEVEKQFPLANYGSWWSSHNKHEAELKEFSNRDSTLSDTTREEDIVRHEENQCGISIPESLGKAAEANALSGSSSGEPEISNTHEEGRDATSPHPEDSHSLCAICMEGFDEGDTIRPLSCGHIFHPLCVDPWLTKRQACCPLCKKVFARHRSPSTETRRARSSFSAILPAPPPAVLLRNDIIPRSP